MVHLWQALPLRHWQAQRAVSAARFWPNGSAIGDHHARYLQDQMDCGGLLLWVNTRDAALEKRAVEILKQHSAGDIHVHALPAAA